MNHETTHAKQGAPVISKQGSKMGEEAALRAELEQAIAHFDAAADRKLDAKNALEEFLMRRGGIAIGDIVADSNGKQYSVTQVAVWDFGIDGREVRFSLIGTPKLKNGSFGSRSHYIGMNWTRVEEGA